MKKLIYILLLLPLLSISQPSDMFWAAGGNNSTESVLFNIFKIDSLDISPQETNVYGLYWLPSGKRMFIVGSSGNGIDEYITSTAWDTDGLTHERFVSTSSQTTNIQDIWFTPDSSKLYLLDFSTGSTDAIYQYSMSPAGDLTTLTYDNKSFTVGDVDALPTGFAFKDDGTAFIMTGTGNDSLYQFSISTSWDISTASYNNVSLDLSTKGTNPNDVFVLKNDSNLLIGDPTDILVSEYENTDVYSDITNSQYLYQLVLGASGFNVSGVFMNPDNTKLFVSDPINDKIYGFE